MSIDPKEPRETRERDIGQVVKYLTGMFNQITTKLDRPFRGKATGPNALYVLQTEFAYIINDLMQAPKCMQQKYIADCNEFIDQTMLELKRMS